jgi:hypothetical protein
VSDTNFGTQNIGNSSQLEIERFKNFYHEFMNHLRESFLPGLARIFALEEDISAE